MNRSRETKRPGQTLVSCLLAVLLTAVGCEKAPETPEEAMTALADHVQDKVREGWKVARVKDAPFKVMDEKVNAGDLKPYYEPLSDGDIVVYRAEPVQLQQRPGLPEVDANPGHIYFVLSLKDYIEPGEYAEMAKANQEAIEKRRWALRDVANIRRDAEGNLKPRGQAESVTVAAWKNRYAKLPPYNAFLPQYHYQGAAVRLRDYRTSLVPEEKEHQQEMNQTYVEIIQILKPYE